jgi:hypothetical protein
MYDCMNRAWEGVLRELNSTGSQVGSRDGAAYEKLNYMFTLAQPSSNFITNPGRKLDPAYAAAETLWYLGGYDEVAPLARYAPSYVKFSEPDGTAHGAYGLRMMPQLPSLLRRLAAPNTRQGVITIWQPRDLVEDHPDIPCTIAMQFQIRGSVLHMTTYMRSNDIWLGLPYDAFAFTTVQQVVAACMKCSLGTYCHVAGNMHLYERNKVEAWRCLGRDDVGSGRHLYSSILPELKPLEVVRDATKLWYDMSTGREFDVMGIHRVASMWPLFGDMLWCCFARHADGDFSQHIQSPAMKAAFLRRHGK